MPLNYSLFYSKILWILFSIIAPLSIIIVIINKRVIIEWNILSINSTQINIPIILDPVRTIFSSTVLLISANVLSFSASYIKSDLFIKRFTHLVILFIISINILVFFPHIITLLLGWDGLGITSFLLVIYYQNPKSLAAGIITALTNRIGDVLLLICIAWTINQGHWNILQIWNSSYSQICIILIIIAAITKRAQIPFSSWLPAAIAAPTPVSALVHSSTLVTAGVFLIIRFYPFLHKLPLFNLSLLFIATLTILIAGLRAITEIDLKKIIALSTLRQLGVIIAALGINLPNIAFFHLVTHAIFKALLFICAGRIIHYNNHSQDIRTIGLLYSQIPITSACLLIANLALIGTPFLAGFYSKDLILELSIYFNINFFILIIFISATILTAIYSLRIILITLWGPQNSISIINFNNNDKFLFTPTLILSLGAIIRGSIINWILIFPNTHPILPPHIINLPLLIVIIGIFIIILSINNYYSVRNNFPLFYYFLSLIWFMVPLSTQNILNTPLSLSKYIYKLTDNGWNEILGGKGIHASLLLIRSSVQKSQIQNINKQLLISSIIIILLLLY